MPHACEQERGEAVGGTVGYSVRLDTRACAATRLLYCTTGVWQLRSAFVTHVAVIKVSLLSPSAWVLHAWAMRCFH